MKLYYNHVIKLMIIFIYKIKSRYIEKFDFKNNTFRIKKFILSHLSSENENTL